MKRTIRLSAAFLVVSGALPIFSGSVAHAKELARVNETVLTDQDLVSSVAAMNESQRSMLLKDARARKQLLNELIDREVLVQEGEKLGLDQEKEFKEAMAAFRKQLLMSRLLDKKLSSQMTVNASKKYYESHKTDFSTDRVRVQHILLADEEEAKKVLQLAKDGKSDFQALAEKFSKDPDAKNTRGELGYIGKDRLAPEFVELAFATTAGEVAGPVKTAFGYHVIKVIHKKFGKPLEYHEVELPVQNALRTELIRNYADGLRQQAKIKIDQKAVEKF